MASQEDACQQPKATLVLVDAASGSPSEQCLEKEEDAVPASSIPTSAATTDQDEDPGDGDKKSDVDDSDDNSAADEKRPAKKKPFKPRTTKGFLATPKDRTVAAKKRGNSLITAAKAFEERTGGLVYVKARYTSEARNKPYVFEFGKDFQTSSDDSPVLAGSLTSPHVVDTEAVKTAVEEGFRGALDKLDQTSPLQGSSGIQPSQNLFGSPSGAAPPVPPRRRQASTTGCIVCSQDDINIDVKGQTVEADWFYCSKVGCRAKAHNECVGFPGAKYATIGAVAKWYCRLHVGQGRPLPENLDDVSVKPAASTAATKAPQKKAADKGNAVGEPKKRGRPSKKT